MARRADLNHDGVVDATDLALFNQGVRPPAERIQHLPATPQDAAAAPVDTLTR